MSETQALLEAYVNQGSEAAFRTLVDRYVDFVYSTARRLARGDSQLAEDITQTVFIHLAKHAQTLPTSVALGGWLHQHTFYVGSKAVRAEQRRLLRERKAMDLNPPQQHAPEPWEKLAPVLDETIRHLGVEDRQAVLLRFFEQRDFRAVGQALGSSEDAARMRVQRALGKLRVLLRERGVEVTTGALAAALSANAVSAAPVGVAALAATAALAQATAGGGLGLILVKAMATVSAKLTLTTLVIAGTAVTLLIQHHARVQQRTQLAALQQQLDSLSLQNESLSNRLARLSRFRAPRLPAPALVNSTVATTNAETLALTNVYALLTNRNIKLSLGQLDPYLASNRRSAASLLAAFRTTGEPQLLAEAMQKFPNNPQVAYEAVAQKDISPEERRHWLDTLKSAAPGNALANYLSAADYFKAGQMDQAVQELVTASGKTEFTDYALDRAQDDEEAYRSAGYAAAESKLVATMQLALPHLPDLRDLSTRMVDLANSYRQAGDSASRQSALDLTAALGRRYSEPTPGESLISELVGVAVERNALAAMDPLGPYNGSSQTVQQRLDELTQRRAAIRDLNARAEALFPSLTQEDWLSYETRSATFGEHAALNWMITRFAQP